VHSFYRKKLRKREKSTSPSRVRPSWKGEGKERLLGADAVTSQIRGGEPLTIELLRSEKRAQKKGEKKKKRVLEGGEV